MSTPPHSPTQPPSYIATASGQHGRVVARFERAPDAALVAQLERLLDAAPTLESDRSEGLVEQVDAGFLNAMATLPWLLRPKQVEKDYLAKLGGPNEMSIVLNETIDRRLAEHITTHALALIGDSLTRVIDECERAIHTLSIVAVQAKKACIPTATSPMRLALGKLFGEVLMLLHIVCFVAGSYMNAELTELRVKGFDADTLMSARNLYLEYARRTTFTIESIDEEGETVETFDSCGTICHIHHHMVAINIQGRDERLSDVLAPIECSEEPPLLRLLRIKLATTIWRFPWMASLQDKGRDLTLSDCFACVTRIEDSLDFADPMCINMSYAIDECDLASTVLDAFMNFMDTKLAEETRTPLPIEMKPVVARFLERVEQVVRSIHLVVAQFIHADMRSVQGNDKERRVLSKELSFREEYYRACMVRTTPCTFALRDGSSWRETQILSKIVESTRTSLDHLNALAAKRALEEKRCASAAHASTPNSEDSVLWRKCFGEAPRTARDSEARGWTSAAAAWAEERACIVDWETILPGEQNELEAEMTQMQKDLTEAITKFPWLSAAAPLTGGFLNTKCTSMHVDLVTRELMRDFVRVRHVTATELEHIVDKCVDALNGLVAFMSKYSVIHEGETSHAFFASTLRTPSVAQSTAFVLTLITETVASNVIDRIKKAWADAPTREERTSYWKARRTYWIWCVDRTVAKEALMFCRGPEYTASRLLAPWLAPIDAMIARRERDAALIADAERKQMKKIADDAKADRRAAEAEAACDLALVNAEEAWVRWKGHRRDQDRVYFFAHLKRTLEKQGKFASREAVADLKALRDRRRAEDNREVEAIKVLASWHTRRRFARFVHDWAVLCRLIPQRDDAASANYRWVRFEVEPATQPAASSLEPVALSSAAKKRAKKARVAERQQAARAAQREQAERDGLRRQGDRLRRNRNRERHIAQPESHWIATSGQADVQVHEDVAREQAHLLAEIQRRARRVPSPSALTPPLSAPRADTAATSEACAVCMDGPMSHAATPCGHMCVCKTCAVELAACPICRTKVTSWLQVFRC